MALAPLRLTGVATFKGDQLHTLEKMMAMTNRTAGGSGGGSGGGGDLGAWFLPHTIHNGGGGSELSLFQDNLASYDADDMDMDMEAASLWEQHLDPNGTDYAFNTHLHIGSSQQDSNLAAFESVLTHLDLYLVPLIILVGLVGNSLSFVVFVATHLKRSSCHIYLASLALADNLFLVCVSISWSDKIGVKLHTQAGWCQTQVYLTHVASFLSAWYVVSFTCERYVATCHPLVWRNRLCTTRAAKCVVVGLAVFALGAYSYTLVTSGVIEIPFTGDRICGPKKHVHVVSTINNVDTLFILIIPTVIIIGCNIRITYVVYTFFKNYRQRHPAGGGAAPGKPSGSCGGKHLQKWDFSGGGGGAVGGGGGGRRSRYNNAGGGVSNAGRSSHAGAGDTVPGGVIMDNMSSHVVDMAYRSKTQTGGTNLHTCMVGATATAGEGGGTTAASRAASRASSSHMRATRMLLIVSTAFLVCNLPSHAARTYSFVMTMAYSDTYRQDRVFILVQKLFRILYDMNFSINFFLYSLSGKSFRSGLRQLKVKIKRKFRNVKLCERRRFNPSPDSSPRLMRAKPLMPFHL